jgi:hypothetical protein
LFKAFAISARNLGFLATKRFAKGTTKTKFKLYKMNQRILFISQRSETMKKKKLMTPSLLPYNCPCMLFWALKL